MDWNAFFGFGTNILVNMLVLTGLLRFVLKMPDSLVFGRILPALGLMMCLSTPVRAEDDCDAVTKRALKEFKTTLDQYKERWVELQGTANESDPPIMQLCNVYKLFPLASVPGVRE